MRVQASIGTCYQTAIAWRGMSVTLRTAIQTAWIYGMPRFARVTGTREHGRAG